MYRKFVFISLLSASLLCLFFPYGFYAKASARTIIVPDEFSSIQSAIDYASVGDTIFVRNGTYYENVMVNKKVSLVGDGRQDTFIDGNGSGTIIKVTADNVAITGFTIRNGGAEPDESGIYVESSYCSITGNTISGNGLTGVYLNSSSGCFLGENTIADNSGEGVMLFYSSNNTCVGNTVTHNNVGFWLISSPRNNLSHNTMIENRNGGVNLFYSSVNTLANNIITDNDNYGLVLDYSSENNTVTSNVVTGNNGTGVMLGSAFGSTLRNNSMAGNRYNFHKVLAANMQDYIVDVDASNTVNRKPIYYLINEKTLELNFTINPNLGYLALINCTNITVEDINLTENGQGLLLAFSRECNLTRLSILNNHFGVQLYSSIRNCITACHISNNSADGVTLDYCSVDNMVSGNTITNNSIGLYVVHSGTNNNTIANNNVINNDRGVRINSYPENNTVVNNTIIHNGQGITITRQSHHTAIVNNRIENNSLGLSIAHSSANSVYHNNFIGNVVQVNVTASTNNMWDDDYPSGGNFWSDFACADLYSGVYQNVTGSDGIGDKCYIIDENNRDRFPVLGLIDRFFCGIWNGEPLQVQVVSNSTVSSFDLNATEKIISFDVKGETGTGFCRVAVPNVIVEYLWQGNYTILVDGNPQLNLRNWTDTANTYIYFTYLHPEHRVIIIPEFPSAMMLTIFTILIIATTIVTIKKLPLKENSQFRNR